LASTRPVAGLRGGGTGVRLGAVVAVRVGEGVGVPVGVQVGVALGVTVGVGVREGRGVGVALGMAVGAIVAAARLSLAPNCGCCVAVLLRPPALPPATSRLPPLVANASKSAATTQAATDSGSASRHEPRQPT